MRNGLHVWISDFFTLPRICECLGLGWLKHCRPLQCPWQTLLINLCTSSGGTQSLLVFSGTLSGPTSLFYPFLEHGQRSAGTGYPAAESGEESV